MEVLRALQELTGQMIFDGSRPYRSELMEAAEGVVDVEPILAELHRLGPTTWRTGLERALYVLRYGPLPGRLAEASAEGGDFLRIQAEVLAADIEVRRKAGYDVTDEEAELENLRREIGA